MFKYLKIGVSALALSAFVIAPAVTIVTADYAYAKNDNGNNGKGGGNKGGGNKGGDRGASGDKGSKGAKAGKSEKAHGHGNRSANRGTVKGDLQKLGRGIKGLFGKKDKTVAKKSHSAKATKQASAKVKDAMHPSNLGKMNGLLNSSINAKLAHIANGQYTKGTGPVSLAAGFAVAEYKLGLTEDAVETLAKSESINEALTNLAGLTEEDIQAAQDAVSDLTDADIQAAQDIVDGTTEATEDEIAEAQKTLDDKAVADAQATVDAAVADGTIDAETGEFTDDFASEVTEAEAVAADALAGTDETDPLAAAEAKAAQAEADALSTYKGDFDSLSAEDQERVRAALRDTVGAEYVDAEGNVVEADAETTAAVAEALERYEAKSAEKVEETAEESAMVDETEGVIDEG